MSGYLRYHPVVGDADREIDAVRPARLLIVGTSVPDAVSLADVARQCQHGDVEMPMGIYLFDDGNQVEAMVVTRGSAPGSPVRIDWAIDDHALASAYDWMGVWWDGASPIPKPRFAPNITATVSGSGQEAVVRRRDFDRGQWWYRVRVDGRTVTVPERDLSAPEIDDDPFEWVARAPAPADRFAATLTRTKLKERLTDTVYSFRATKTIFRAYQFRPIIRLLQTGQLRLLIADEVGLGKTIEAGLVWVELDARGQADRVLVVCPSMLVPKWQAEMRERFDYELVELNRSRLDELLVQATEDRVPKRFAVVCSLERLRVWGGIEAFAGTSPSFDLVIVDEAHAFRNSGTKSHALGALLSDWAGALVFLSATPLNLGNDDLYSLLELLAPGEFDDRFVLEQRLEPNAVLHDLSVSLLERGWTNSGRLRLLRTIEGMPFGPAVTARPEYRELEALLLEADPLRPNHVARAKRLMAQLHALSAVVSRTRKVEVQEHKAVRRAERIEVKWTEPEQQFYSGFERWQIGRAHALRLPVGFVTQMPLRLASTCLPAARDRVLDWRNDAGDEDLDALEDDQQWEMTTPPPELVALARQLGDVDTKFDAFLEYLRSIVQDGRRVLVFTFSRRALAYLQHRLDAQLRIAVMHGGIDRDERHLIMRRFRDHEFDVLLASRVASEGLDFEFCSAVVNYDLPWNPMEVEQRIGRVDRFGQTEEKILVLNFYTPGTIESDIIERVHQRLGVFKASIGELEPILQSRLGDLRRTMFDFQLTEAERNRRLDETLAAIEEQRLALDDVESASSYLASTDEAEIDGLERDLLATGRYVGQPSLFTFSVTGRRMPREPSAPSIAQEHTSCSAEPLRWSGTYAVSRRLGSDLVLRSTSWPRRCSTNTSWCCASIRITLARPDTSSFRPITRWCGPHSTSLGPLLRDSLLFVSTPTARRRANTWCLSPWRSGQAFGRRRSSGRCPSTSTPGCRPSTTPVAPCWRPLPMRRSSQRIPLDVTTTPMRSMRLTAHSGGDRMRRRGDGRR